MSKTFSEGSKETRGQQTRKKTGKISENARARMKKTKMISDLIYKIMFIF